MSQQEDDCLTALLLTDLDTHFRQLVESYQHSLYRVMYRQVGCEQDAEDLVQETFVRAYYALRDYAAQGRRLQSVRPWLYKIAFHLYYNRIRTTRPLMFPLDLPALARAVSLFALVEHQVRPGCCCKARRLPSG